MTVAIPAAVAASDSPTGTPSLLATVVLDSAAAVVAFWRIDVLVAFKDLLAAVVVTFWYIDVLETPKDVLAAAASLRETTVWNAMVSAVKILWL